MSNTSPTAPTTPATSGTETPDPVLMGIAPEENEEVYDTALREAFGIDPDSEGETTDEPPIEGTETQPEEEGSEEQPSDVATGEGELDLAALFTQRYGHEPTQEELSGLIQLADWAASLTLEQQQAINYALANPQQVIQPQPTPTPVAEDTPDPLEEQYADDPLYQRLKQIEAEQQRFAQQTADQQRQRAVTQINLGLETFKSEYSYLSDSDLSSLQTAVANSGILPGFVSANNDNVQLAMQKALEYAYWQTPSFREQEIQRRMEAERATQKSHTERQRKASSVTGTGGNGASRTEPPKGTDPWALVAAGIREVQNNGEPQD